MRVKMLSFIICCVLTPGCSDVDIGTVPDTDTEERQEEEAEEIPYTSPDENGDAIPDFSRVGYRWGEKELPEYDIVSTVTPPGDGSDATALLQAAVDNAPSPGTILLKDGTYNISGTIYLNRNGIVLRGNGNKTVLKATGTSQRPLIYFGGGAERQLEGAEIQIAEEYVPTGRFYLELAGESPFLPGDEVVISWIPDDEWITALKMDQIPPRSDGIAVPQWNAAQYDIYWERTVVASNGKYVYLDNPVVMPLDARYGKFYLSDYSYPNRITESGIENMSMVSEYASDEDEDHSWTAIEVHAAEHCWIRNVESSYFAFGCVDMKSGAKNITVSGCICRDPKARTEGSRKYGFYVTDGQQCLVMDCLSIGSRHGFSSSARVGGPNVFLRCEEQGGLGDCGPHQRWSTGMLYDNVKTDSKLRVQDRGNMGPGHGWAGVTHVFWNCTAAVLTCQSPWVTGKNWCIGCIGTKDEGNFSGRPDGVWESHGMNVAPQSLYEQQLSNRKSLGQLSSVPGSKQNQQQ